MTQQFPHIVVDWGIPAVHGADLSPEFRFFLPAVFERPQIWLRLDQRIDQTYWQETPTATWNADHWSVRQMLRLEPNVGGKLGGEYLLHALVRTATQVCYRCEIRLPVASVEGGTLEVVSEGVLSLEGLKTLAKGKRNVVVKVGHDGSLVTRESASELAGAMQQLGPSPVVATRETAVYPLHCVSSLPDWEQAISEPPPSATPPVVRSTSQEADLRRLADGTLSLTLQGQDVTDQALQSLPSIDSLRQRAAAINEELPVRLRDFQKLSQLYLSKTRITAAALIEINHLGGLKRLDVRDTSIARHQLGPLSRLGQLRQLWYSHNEFVQAAELQSLLSTVPHDPC